MKMQMQVTQGPLLSTKVVTWLISIATLSVLIFKGAQTGYAMIGRVNNAVQLEPYVEHVHQDSIHFARLDSLIFVNQRENRQLLCYLAKNPAPMVATGICKL